MKQRALVRLAVCVTAALVLTLSPSVALADHGKDYAKGTYKTFGGSLTVDFSAQSSSLGTNVQGSARFRSTSFDPNIVVTGAVTCLTVVNGFAGLSGEIISVHGGAVNPGCPTCRGFLIQVFDSGKFSNNPDFEFFSYFLLPPTTCPVGGTFTPVVDGEIVVHSSPP